MEAASIAQVALITLQESKKFKKMEPQGSKQEDLAEDHIKFTTRHQDKANVMRPYKLYPYLAKSK